MKTTYEMDGMLTQEDIDNREKVVFQCSNCNKWTPHSNWLAGGKNKLRPCNNCGLIQYDIASIKSWRTYNPLTDNKRRPKAQKKKQ